MRAKRNELLRGRADALLAYSKAMDEMERTTLYTDAEQAALKAADEHFRRAVELEEGYLKALPRLVMSRCPFDDQPLHRTFDPFGLDGPWWRGDASPEEPVACRHFLVLDGALHLNGRPAQAGPFEVRPGPQVPFVMPRLLEKDGVKAVVSRITMENGYVAYPVAYFADRRPPPQDLTAGWGRVLYLYETQLGETSWRVANESWDFELEPWLSSGKLLWTTGEGEAMRLEHGTDCPYVGLPGERRPAVLEGDRIWFEVPPDGRPGRSCMGV